MIYIDQVISGLKRFAKTTGGEYSERQGVEYFIIDVKYSNGLITTYISERREFVYQVLLSTTEATTDGGKLECTVGLFMPDSYFDVYPEDKNIEIGNSNPPMYVIFKANDGRVENIGQVVQSGIPDRTHKVRIVRSEVIKNG